MLKVLAESGGSAKPRDIYPKVAAYFPELSAEEQEQRRLESSASTRKWWNLVQWVRQRLVESREIDGSTRGVWTLTDAGRARLSPPRGQAGSTPVVSVATEQVADLTLRDLANRSRDQAKSRLLTELKGLTPTGFEHFCMELLQQLGFNNVAVTRRAGDGGIDGRFPARRCQHPVGIPSETMGRRSLGRPEIDKLRGAIQGDYDHGATSRFTKEATEASYKKGAITILLLDGGAIAELMIDRGMGVVKQPLYLYEIDAEFFDFDKPDD